VAITQSIDAQIHGKADPENNKDAKDAQENAIAPRKLFENEVKVAGVSPSSSANHPDIGQRWQTSL